MDGRVNVNEAAPANAPSRSRRVAAVVLGLLMTGAGHFVLGRGARGAVWMAVALGCALATLGGAFVGTPFMVAAFAGSQAAWIGSLVDVFRVRPLDARPSCVIVAVPVAAIAAYIAMPLAIRPWLVEPYRIPSASMSPTLLPGDQVLVDKRPSHRRSVSRGDVIVFELPGDRRKHYIKRVVGLPGDVIELVGGRLYVNGTEAPASSAGTMEIPLDDCRMRTVEVFDETLDGRGYRIARVATGGYLGSGRWVVPEGELFVLGDHRDNAADSRTGFTVPYDHVRGHAARIHLSWDACAGRLRTERTGIRLD